MKITYQESQTRSIDLPKEAVKEITIKFLQELIAPGEYIREEKRGNKKVLVLKQDDPEWRHGSVSENYVRDATEVDIAALTLIHFIRDSHWSK